MNNTYTIKSYDFVIRDKEIDIKDYFDRSYKIFLNRLEELKNFKEELSAAQEKELQFMLETLIDTKRLLQK